jgi:hypothetical protein
MAIAMWSEFSCHIKVKKQFYSIVDYHFALANSADLESRALFLSKQYGLKQVGMQKTVKIETEIKE